jgi:hypothetical protein
VADAISLKFDAIELAADAISLKFDAIELAG